MSSESRDYRLFIQDMVECCDKITRYTAGQAEAEFFADELVFDAVNRNLTILGEAAKNIPDDVRERHQAIPWRKMAGFRDVAIHFYFGRSREIIWDIVSRQVPAVAPLLRSALESER